MLSLREVKTPGLQPKGSYSVICSHDSRIAPEGYQPDLFRVGDDLMIIEFDVFFEYGPKKVPVVGLLFDRMRKEKILLVRDERLNRDFLDPQHDLGRRDVIGHLDPFFGIFAVGKGPVRARFGEYLHLRKGAQQKLTSLWSQNNSSVGRVLSLPDYGKLHRLLDSVN